MPDLVLRDNLASFAYKIGRLVKFIFFDFILAKCNLNFGITKVLRIIALPPRSQVLPYPFLKLYALLYYYFMLRNYSSHPRCSIKNNERIKN